MNLLAALFLVLSVVLPLLPSTVGAQGLVEDYVDVNFVDERFLLQVDAHLKREILKLEPFVYHPEVKIYTHLSSGRARSAQEFSLEVGRKLRPKEVDLLNGRLATLPTVDAVRDAVRATAMQEARGWVASLRTPGMLPKDEASAPGVPVNPELGEDGQSSGADLSVKPAEPTVADWREIKLDKPQSHVVEFFVTAAMKKALQLLTKAPAALFTGIFMVFESPLDSGSRAESEFMSESEREYAKAKVQFAEAYKRQQQLMAAEQAARGSAGSARADRDIPDGSKSPSASSGSAGSGSGGNNSHDTQPREPKAPEPKAPEPRAPEPRAPEPKSNEGRSVEMNPQS